MDNKPKRKKATRKQREARRALHAKIYSEGFEKGYEMCERIYQQRLDKLCRHNCEVTG